MHKEILNPPPFFCSHVCHSCGYISNYISCSCPRTLLESKRPMHCQDVETKIEVETNPMHYCNTATIGTESSLNTVISRDWRVE